MKEHEHMNTNPASASVLSPIRDIIEDIRAGKMVILIDDEDRENEGDIVIAAVGGEFTVKKLQIMQCSA